MNTQVQRLEQLLARVQRNREKPRHEASDKRPIAEHQPAPGPAADDLGAAAALAAAQQAATAGPGPQISAAAKDAREDRVQPVQAQAHAPAEARPQAAPQRAPARRPAKEPVRAQPVQARPTTRAAVPAHAPAAQSQPRSAPEMQPARVAAEPVRGDARDVAAVVSQHPDIGEMTFGELLNRSLALRPR